MIFDIIFVSMLVGLAGALLSLIAAAIATVYQDHKKKKDNQ